MTPAPSEPALTFGAGDRDVAEGAGRHVAVDDRVGRDLSRGDGAVGDVRGENDLRAERRVREIAGEDAAGRDRSERRR